MTRSEAIDFCERYIVCCNEHRFDELGSFVCQDVNSPNQDLIGHIDGPYEVIASFSDFHWQVKETLLTRTD